MAIQCCFERYEKKYCLTLSQQRFLLERMTGLEPATSTLARWRTTNCTTVAFSLSLMYLSDEIYNNTASYVWQAFS